MRVKFLKHARDRRDGCAAKCGAPVSNPKRETAVNWAFVKCDACLSLKRVSALQPRFWMKVNKSTLTGCWLYTGSATSEGYGRFWHKGRHLGAHRFSYELNVGPIPSDKVVCHRCDNTICVRPEHLFLGSLAENSQDCLLKDRKRTAKLKVTQVMEIKRRLAYGDKPADIARYFNIGPSAIYFIKMGKTWKKVESEKEGTNGKA